MNINEIGKLTEDEAREYMENLRWPNGPVCPHCEAQDVTRMQGDAHRPGTIQCNACREQFTVTVGTVLESSHIPLSKWVMAFHMMCSSKKGISALQLQRNLGLGSYRSAWFMCHRIRLAMSGEPAKALLKGVVECDETYVGGKPRVKGTSKRGRGTKKTPVMVLVERDGSARCKPLERVDGETLKGEIAVQVAKEAIIVTDELASYHGVGENHLGGHETVNHSRKEYVRYGESGLQITTNSAESFFALIKRGHYGVYHQMSRKHLFRYCDEFSFRWDHRKTTDATRREAAIRLVEGKRLMYQSPDTRPA